MLVREDMNILESPIERLRPLLGLKSWDYCVFWKLGIDQRFIEWMGCCCGGAENNQKEENLFPVSPMIPCRDVMFQHPRTKACDALAELPSSIPLDSGTYTQVLISDQPIWLNQSNTSDANISDEPVKTKVLIPVTGGLVELFVAKQVPEDQKIIEFVMALWDQEATMILQNPTFQPLDCSPLNDGFTDENPIDHPPKHFYTTKNSDHFQPWIPLPTDNLNFPWNLTSDQTNLYNSSLNFIDNQPKNDIFFEGSGDTIEKPPDSELSNILALQNSLRAGVTNLHQSKEPGYEKDSVKMENGRGDSISDCSDQMEEEEDQKVVGRSGRRNQSKNLVAERKRRRKLNDRLYALRALVPKITKMDRASILGDAIEYVKELQKQAKDLQDELEETPDEDGAKPTGNNTVQLEIPNQNAVNHGDEESPNGSTIGTTDHGNAFSLSNRTADLVKQNHDSFTEDKTQQMEVQVDVSQVGGNEFFLKVFCENKPGGFVRLMEALNSLGLEVTNANVTTFSCLVLNVLKVEKRDDEVVQAEQVRDSLLELTRNPNEVWSDQGRATENGAIDYHHHHNHHHHHLNSHHHPHHLHHQP
ncbi:basic helix-loop-helix (bHLH) DNA-binding superfamily protein isoform X2 [Tasmannia lanceolata]